MNEARGVRPQIRRLAFSLADQAGVGSGGLLKTPCCQMDLHTPAEVLCYHRLNDQRHQ